MMRITYNGYTVEAREIKPDQWLAAVTGVDDTTGKNAHAFTTKVHQRLNDALTEARAIIDGDSVEKL